MRTYENKYTASNSGASLTAVCVAGSLLRLFRSAGENADTVWGFAEQRFRLAAWAVTWGMAPAPLGGTAPSTLARAPELERITQTGVRVCAVAPLAAVRDSTVGDVAPAEGAYASSETGPIPHVKEELIKRENNEQINGVVAENALG